MGRTSSCGTADGDPEAEMTAAEIERRLRRLPPKPRKRIVLFACVLSRDPGQARALGVPPAQARKFVEIGFALNNRRIS